MVFLSIISVIKGGGGSPTGSLPAAVGPECLNIYPQYYRFGIFIQGVLIYNTALCGLFDRGVAREGPSGHCRPANI